MFKLELPHKMDSEGLEKMVLELGLSERYAKTICAVSSRKKLVPETIMGLYVNDQGFRDTVVLYKSLQEDPHKFYSNNKKLSSGEKKLLTFGSLSLSYSFASPHRLIRSILSEGESLAGYVQAMREISNSEYTLSDVASEAFMLNDSYLNSQVREKYAALRQDLRGNKVPLDLLDSLLDKVCFEKRDVRRDLWGFSGMTQESIIDSLYLFFGSRKGSDAVSLWSDKIKREALLDEFEYLMYNSPYINPLLIDKSLSTYGSSDFIESAQSYLDRNEGVDVRTSRGEIDFGLND